MGSVSLYVGLAAIGLAIVMGVVALLGRPAAAAPAPAETLPVAVPPRRTSGFDEIPPLVKRMAAIARRLSPSGYTQRLQRRLDLAGNPPRWPASRVMACKGLGLVAGALVGAALGLPRGADVLIFAPAAAALLFYLPDLLVRNAGEKRQQQLLRGLPDALDMMTVCVEAGLGFDSALSRVALNLEGPMAQECARVLQEMQFGKSRQAALRSLADRTAVPEIKAFVSALVQASDLGISVGSVLREQAAEMRVRRRQRAEEKAQKLTVKILLPLILCLLPAMFVVILGPAAIKIMHTLGHLSGM